MRMKPLTMYKNVEVCVILPKKMLARSKTLPKVIESGRIKYWEGLFVQKNKIKLHLQVPSWLLMLWRKNMSWLSKRLRRHKSRRKRLVLTTRRQQLKIQLRLLFKIKQLKIRLNLRIRQLLRRQTQQKTKPKNQTRQSSKTRRKSKTRPRKKTRLKQKRK